MKVLGAVVLAALAARSSWALGVPGAGPGVAGRLPGAAAIPAAGLNLRELKRVLVASVESWKALVETLPPASALAYGRSLGGIGDALEGIDTDWQADADARLRFQQEALAAWEQSFLNRLYQAVGRGSLDSASPSERDLFLGQVARQRNERYAQRRLAERAPAPALGLEARIGALNSAEALNGFYDGAARAEGAAVAASPADPRGGEEREWLTAEEAARYASVPPPAMVSNRRAATYSQMTGWMGQVMEKIGLAGFLRNWNVDAMSFGLSLTKAESEFNPNAESSAGAFGLMQLLVPTAQWMLRKNEAEYRRLMTEAGLQPLRAHQITGETLKRDWRTNMILGTFYLREHAEEFSRVVANVRSSAEHRAKLLMGMIAGGHNAGGGAVRKYLASLKRRGIDLAHVDANKSIVPYRETMGYVSKIQRWYREWSSWISGRSASAAAESVSLESA